MSKLTNYQIAACIRGLEQTLASSAYRGDFSAARRVTKKLDSYKAELKQRQDAGLNPGTEIQESHNK